MLKLPYTGVRILKIGFLACPYWMGGQASLV